MNSPLHILHLEDNPAEGLLVRDQLAQDELAAEVRLVDNRAAFEQALEERPWDLVLADYKLPGYNGLEALKLVRQKYPLLPFILMSGTLGEAAAIESLKGGATDYVLKQHRDRLPAAVRRAVAEAAERQRRHAAEEEMRRSEKHYRLLFQGNPHPMWVFDLETLAILEVNEAATQHYGYAREEFLGMTLADLRVPDDPRFGKPQLADIKAQGLVWRHRRKNGAEMDMEVIWSPLAFNGRLAALALATDVTVRRRVTQRNSVFGRLSHNLSVVTTAGRSRHVHLRGGRRTLPLGRFCNGSLFGGAGSSGFAADDHDRRRAAGGDSVVTAAQDRQHAGAAGHRARRRVGGRGRDGRQGGDHDAGAHPQGRPRDRRACSSSAASRTVMPRATWKYCRRWPTSAAARCSACRWRRNCARASGASAICLKTPRTPFLSRTWRDGCWTSNRGACTLHGMTREQLLGSNAIETLVPPGRRAAAREEFQQLAAGRLSSIESESLRADGRTVPVEIRVVRVEYDGAPALLFHVRDITERRAAEMALRSSETLFRSVWENSVDGMRLTDENGIIIAANQAFCRLVGLSA